MFVFLSPWQRELIQKPAMDAGTTGSPLSCRNASEVCILHTYLSMEGFFWLRGTENFFRQREAGSPSSKSSENTALESLDFIRAGSFWVTESLFLLHSPGLAWNEALLKMFQATVDVGISALYSRNRMCTWYKVPQVPIPRSCLLKPSSWKVACGRQTSQTLRRKSFSPPELCMALEFGVKHGIILFVSRLHADGKCVRVKDPSG